MRRSLAETIVALVVLITASVFLWHAARATDVDIEGGFVVTAEFFDVGGLEILAPVLVGGARVGTVTNLQLDQFTYLVIVEATLAEGARLPADSSASIGSFSLLGGSALVIAIGSSTEYVADGGRITRTNNARSIEDEFGLKVFGGLE